MSNNSSYKYNEIGHTYKYDENILKKTQQRLKAVEDGEVLEAIVNIVAKSVMEEKPVLNEVCKETQNWILTSYTNKNEVSFMLHKNIKVFLENIKKENDFRKAFVFKDEKINIWIVVDEADYEVNSKYINFAREVLNKEYQKISLMIYSFDEVDEVKEELDGIKYISIEEE